MADSQPQSTDQVPRSPASPSNRPPKIVWVIALPGLCILIWAMLSGLLGGSKSNQYRRLEEPAYTNLKRELETEGVEVRNIKWKQGGTLEGVVHDIPAVGQTWVYVEIALNKPGGKEADAASRRVVTRFLAYARSRKLGFVVNYATFQFWSPASYIADVDVEK